MRVCERCGAKLDPMMRRTTRFCSGRCRVAAHRAKPTFPPEMRGKRWTRADGKRPIRTSGQWASSTNRLTWAHLEDVQAATVGDGYGIMLGAGLGCYDIDHATDEQVRQFAATISEPIVFAERSLSGTGAHIFVKAPEAAGWKKTINGVSVERYTANRFIRVTGNRLDL